MSNTAIVFLGVAAIVLVIVIAAATRRRSGRDRADARPGFYAESGHRRDADGDGDGDGGGGDGGGGD